MKRLFAALCMGPMSISLWAQCSMTVIVYPPPSWQACGPSMDYAVNTTGGTPPFTIQAGIQGFPGQTFTNDTDGDASGMINVGLDSSPFQVYATVTDAMGCVVSATANFTPRRVMQTNVDFLIDSVNERAVLRTFYSRVGSSWDVATICTGQSGLFTTNVGGASSTLASAWTFVPGSPGRWNYQTTLPPGLTQFIAGGPLGSPDCSGYLQCCCADQTTTIDVPMVPHYNENGGVNVRPRLLLQGPVVNGLMIDSLRAKGLVPLQEPYSGLGYTYTGVAAGLITTPAVLAVTGNNAVVDWVVVELRSTTAPYAVLASRPALVQRDGDVMDRDGDGYLHFGSRPPGSYRVSLRHRNHLGVMTFGNVNLIASPVPLIDFTGGSAYGTSPLTLVSGKYCLWAGDGNGNGTLGYTGLNNDRDPILTAIGGTTPNNTLNNVYDRRDVNLDGVIKYTGANNDRDPILTNVGSTTPNNTRIQQLP